MNQSDNTQLTFIYILVIIIMIVGGYYYYTRWTAWKKSVDNNNPYKGAVQECPDYWTYNSTNKNCENINKIGSYPAKTADFNDPKYKDAKKGLDEKCKWAATYNTPWEGVDNRCTFGTIVPPQ